MKRIVKNAFNWYCNQFNKIYEPMINAGVNPWM